MFITAAQASYKANERGFAMTRREEREQAFCLLFEQAAVGGCMKDILETAVEARDLQPGDFTRSLIFGVEEHAEEIDGIISAKLLGWRMQRLSHVAVSALRLAVYEMLYEESIPVAVSINEAVELAKIYGGPQDANYVNGVLSSIAKELENKGLNKTDGSKENLPK